MMKTNIYLAGLAAAFSVTACIDVNDDLEGFDELVEQAKTITSTDIVYTLTAEDYKTISGYADAESEDADALAAVASSLNFPSMALAQKYLPKFIAANYYHLDKGSAVYVNYNLAGEIPTELAKLDSASLYEFSADDYAAAGASAGYVTPSTAAGIPSALKAAVSDAQSGDYCVVSYLYSPTEPSADNEDVAPVSNWEKVSATLPTKDSWTFIGSGNVDLTPYIGKKVRVALRYTSTAEKAGTAEAKNFMVAEAGYVYPTLFTEQADGTFASSTTVSEGKALILAKVGEEYFSFSALKDASKTYGYCTSEAVAVVDGVVAADAAAAHTVTIEAGATEGAYYIKSNSGKYFYMSGTYNSFNVADAVPAEVGEDGYEWSFSASANALFVTNVVKGKTVAYDANYNSFGSYDEAKRGVYYNEPLTGLEAFPEGFESVNIEMPESATYIWSYASDYGCKASAYISKVNCASESWLILPEVDLTGATAPYFSMDVCGNFFGDNMAEYFGVYVSTDYTTGSDINVADANKSLKAAAATETVYALYAFNGNSWAASDDAIVLQPADYEAMGLSYGNFSSTVKPDSYLPKFLAMKAPYAAEGDVQRVLYRTYEGGTTISKVAEYILTEGAWTVNEQNTEVSDHFVLVSSGWIYDPSVTIEVPYDRNSAFSKSFYQASVDWVWENVDTKLGFTSKGEGYVSSYGNNDYYTGCSAYYGNVDWRPAKAREQYPEPFEGMSDEEVVATMQKRFAEVYQVVLPTLYPDAKPIEGVDVFYNINFTVYFDPELGSNYGSHVWTISYKVVGNAEFEYVEGSLKPVE